MFKKMGLATLAISLSSVSVFANQLPDEINYSPYQSIYEQIESERSATEGSLNDQRTIRANLLQAIDEQLQFISNLEDQIDQDNQRIGFINSEVPRLESIRRDVDRNIANCDEQALVHTWDIEEWDLSTY